MERDVKVKSYLRKGKLVRAFNYKRKASDSSNKDKLIKSTAAIASVLGVSVAGYIALKYKYRRNLDTIANKLVASGTGRVIDKPLIGFSIGGFGFNRNNSISAVDTAKDISTMFKAASPNIEAIDIQKGFTSSKAFKNKARKTWSMGIGFLRNHIKNDKKITREIAEEIYDYHLKNPGKPIYVAGYSAGGAIGNDLAYIFKKKNIDINLITLGEPNFKILPRTQKTLAIHSNKDTTKLFKPPDAKLLNSINSHDDKEYTTNKDVLSEVKGFINKTAKFTYTNLITFAKQKKREKLDKLSNKQKIIGGIGALATVGAVAGGVALNKKLGKMYTGLNLNKWDKLRFAASKRIPISRRNQYLVKETANQIIKEPFQSVGGILKRVTVKPFTKKDGTKVAGYVREVIGAKQNVAIANTLDDFVQTGGATVQSFNTTFVVQRNGIKYIYKEAPKAPMGTQKTFGQIAAATEALASDIAESAGIKVQKTIIAPAGASRKFGDVAQPATLHEFVPGIPAIEAEKKGLIKKAGIALKPYTDRRSLESHDLVKKFMTTLDHPDTSKLSALDIFIGNRDRDSNNYFYDKVTDSFTGIDHGGSGLYKPDFFEIKLSIADSFSKLSDKQKTNLSTFKKTLQELVDKNKPDDVNKRLTYYYDVANGGKSNPLGEAAKERNKQVMEHNYNNVKELIKWMDKIGV